MQGDWIRRVKGVTSSALLAFAISCHLSSCTPAEEAVATAISGTLGAQKAVSDDIATGIASTLAAMPSATLQPATAEVPAQATLGSSLATIPPDCAEDMSQIRLLGIAFLTGDRFMITLGKPEAFAAREYILVVDGAKYDCERPGETGDRVYCVGPHFPPPGREALELWPATESCRFQMPLEVIPIPPKPTEDRRPGYSD